MTKFSPIFSEEINKNFTDFFSSSSFRSYFSLLSLSILLPTTVSFASGMPVKACLLFAIYALFYHGLSGFLILSIFKENISEDIKIPFVLISGICYNIITFLLLSFFNLQKFITFNILILFFISVLFRKEKLNYKLKNNVFSKSSFFVLFLFLIPLFCGGLEYLFQSFPNHHFNFQGAIANKLIHFPYPFFWHTQPEASLYYNYGYHIELACCSTITSIPLNFLSYNIYPFYILFLLIYFLYFFCLNHFEGKKFTGCLTLINNFCVIGFGSLSTFLFLIIIPSSTIFVGSSLLAFVMFFALIDRIDDFFNQDNLSKRNYLFLLFLFLTATITRSALPPILIGAISFFIGIKFFKDFKINFLIIKSSILVFSFSLIFLLGLIVIYGYFSPNTATGFIRFGVQNSVFNFLPQPEWLKIFWDKLFLKTSNSFISQTQIKALVHILLTPGYLTIGFYYQIYRWTKTGMRDLDLLLICCAVVGLVVWNFSAAPGDSHYTFHHYFSLICGIYGANGTYLLVKETLKKMKGIYFLLILMTTILFSLKGYELYTELNRVINTKNFIKNHITYSTWPDKLIEKITALSQKEENSIFISLDTNDLQNDHIISIALGKIPFINPNYLNYGLKILKSAEDRKRSMDIQTLLYSCLTKKSLTIEDINKIRYFFPNKDILLLVRSYVTTNSQHLNVIDRVEDYTILKAPALHQTER